LGVRTFAAKIILGQKEAPPPERLRRHDGVDLSSGVNFANSGSGVFPGWNLDKQIKKFKRLLRKRIIGKDLSQSVALVSIASCADYADVPSDLPDMDPLVSRAHTAMVSRPALHACDVRACADN
jgi:hypothetical protein